MSPLSTPASWRSPLLHARLAGAGYLLIIVSGILAEFVIRSGLIVRGDPGATATNLMASELLYRGSLVAEFVMLAADVAVALALYVVFAGVSRSLALLAAFFRLTHAAVVSVNLLNVYVPLLILGGAPYLHAFDEGQRSAMALLLLDVHAYGYALGLVFFALCCGILGWLILRSRYVPRALGVLLLVAAAGYLADSLARTLLADYAAVEDVMGMVVLVPAFVGELSFGLWLLVKGVDVRRLPPAPGGGAP